MSTDTHTLLLLLNWMSPAFPVGSFAYSHGQEWAIAEGGLRDGDTVESWIAALLRSGSGWNDAVLFARCWHGDAEELNALALALAGSAERYAETTDLGRNFAMAAAVWTGAAVPERAIAYPIAAGSACKAMGVGQEQAIAAYLQGFASALVSVAVRLVPLGQTRGLQALRNLMPVIAETAARATAATLDDLGSNAIAAEIAAMKHETLETRIFRT